MTILKFTNLVFLKDNFLFLMILYQSNQHVRLFGIKIPLNDHFIAIRENLLFENYFNWKTYLSFTFIFVSFNRFLSEPILINSVKFWFWNNYFFVCFQLLLCPMYRSFMALTFDLFVYFFDYFNRFIRLVCKLVFFIENINCSPVCLKWKLLHCYLLKFYDTVYYKSACKRIITNGFNLPHYIEDSFKVIGDFVFIFLTDMINF